MGNLNFNVQDILVERKQTTETDENIIVLTVISDTQKVVCEIIRDMDKGLNLNELETEFNKYKYDVLNLGKDIGISKHLTSIRSSDSYKDYYPIKIKDPNGDSKVYLGKIHFEEM